MLAAELALERVEAELATELPPHMRAFARAHAAGALPPAAPDAARRPSSVAIARAALEHPALARRGASLLRLVAPIAIEDDPDVARARAAAASWPALAALARARDAAARARFGVRCVELMHALHGVPAEHAPPPTTMDPALAAWTAPAREIERAEIDAIWRALAARHGAAGAPAILASVSAQPRAFLVEPGREVIVVVPARADAPAARFAILHELGHALAGLLAAAPLPRSVDEAVASFVARAMETPDHPWHSADARAARDRRTAIAATLDAIERALPALGDALPAQPPPALWHDPGAQAAYLRAESIADRWSADAVSPAWSLAAAITAEAAEVAAAVTPR